MTLPFFPIIGIDIGASSVKIVELSGKGPTKKLRALGLELLPADTFADGQLQDQEKVENAIMDLMDKLRLDPRGRRAAVSITGTAVEMKRILVDAAVENFDEHINYEAEQHFQQDIGELVFKYQRLDTWTEDPSKVPVLLVGANRDIIDQYVAIVRTCGMRTGIVDCDSLCLANTLEMNYPGRTDLVAIIELGAQRTSVTLICNGQFLYTKYIEIGGFSTTRQISQVLALDYENTETMKLAVSQGGAAAPEPMARAIAELNQALVAEIQEALKLYFENSTPIPGITGISNVLLSGGGARLLGLDAALAAALQVPVQSMNPFNKISINPRQFEVDYILMQGHVYSIAMGLALRRMGDEKE